MGQHYVFIQNPNTKQWRVEFIHWHLETVYLGKSWTSVVDFMWDCGSSSTYECALIDTRFPK